MGRLIPVQDKQQCAIEQMPDMGFTALLMSYGLFDEEQQQQQQSVADKLLPLPPLPPLPPGTREWMPSISEKEPLPPLTGEQQQEAVSAKLVAAEDRPPLPPVTPEKTTPARRKRKPQQRHTFDLNELPPMEPVMSEPKPKKHRPRVAKDKTPRKKKAKSPLPTNCSSPASAAAAAAAAEPVDKDPSQIDSTAVKGLIDGLQRLDISDEGGNQIVKYELEQRIVHYVDKKKKKLRAKVSLDVETTKMWNLLMARNAEHEEQKQDQSTADRWAKERTRMKHLAEAFISKMHLVQGDRTFSKWKGSVVDSIVGAFLTQNVSDHLSSSAFMAVASKFPVAKKEEAPKKTTNSADSDEEGRSSRSVRRCLFGSSSGEVGVQQLAQLATSTVRGDVSLITKQVGESRALVNRAVKKSRQRYDETLELTGEPKTPASGAKKRMSGIELANLEHSQGSTKKSYKWDDLKAKVFQDREGATKSPCGPPDSVDWTSVMLANVKELADVIKERGMNNLLAGRIKAFLERVYEEHGDIDLEWIRKVPPEEAKEFLLSIRGLGLKSVECIRLLELEHLAFPVDTNVGRICVRLGWVPIEPLPEELQLHLLELYPVQTTIQKYLWPRLCKLEQRTLYELHYQMITFGKVFCTKSRPNCHACPMKQECRHFASAYASSKLALPSSTGPADKNKPSAPASTPVPSLALPNLEDSTGLKICVPIIEEPSTPEACDADCCSDIEDLVLDERERRTNDEKEDGILTINLREEDVNRDPVVASKALVVVPPEFAYIPAPKLKVATRLRTVHYVYELPDDHHLLQKMERREADDPGFYLLAIWGPGDEASRPALSDFDYTQPSSCSQEAVKGTLLIPCRTAMRGSFPLNGTYFQVNEVFADHSSSWSPIDVPRASLWNLRRRFVYFGTSVTSIFRGLTTEEIQACFWKGYVCVRGFDITSRAPKPLMTRFHLPPTRKQAPNTYNDD